MEEKVFQKSPEFLSQIPDWEKEYKESDVLDIQFKKDDWKNAEAHFSEHDLKIFGHAVMEDWETPYMEALADIACQNGGTVLELGFGMGISARFIQEHDIQKHIIIEVNAAVAEKAREFAKNVPHMVEILKGLWEDVIDQIPDGSLDGILFDTYPLTEDEVYQNHFGFFKVAYQKLKTGGIFTYYSDEISEFGPVHLKKLQEAGFKKGNIHSKITLINPPEDCEYWKANTILSPIICK